jgi:hypothetical protein
MIRPLAFCAGLALAWCGTAEAEDFALCPSNVTTKTCLEAVRQLTSGDISDRLSRIEKRLDSIERWIGCRQHVGSQTPC